MDNTVYSIFCIASLDCVSGYRIYNLGSNHPGSVKQLVEMLGKTLGINSNVEYLPVQTGDIERTWEDISQAERELKYRPVIEITAGLEQFCKWLISRGEIHE